MDGKADDAAWAEAVWSEDFTQRSPLEGKSPTEETRVAVLYDDSALYVLVDARDSRPDRVRARLTRRDEDSASDWIEIWLAPQRDRRHGYRFAVNPLGVQIDSRLSDTGEHQDRDWNGVWQVATHRSALGWSAEFRIPYSQLRFQQPDEPWGMNVVRRLARANEESVLSPTPKSASRPLSFAAELRGMGELVARPKRLELRPYGSMDYRRLGGLSEFVPHFGGDADIGLGTSRALNLTVFPDFGQVQSDPSQLNLTAFEIFLPEKRQFFLDGREVFRFPLAYRGRLNENLFYSRRIGARPSRVLEDADSIIDYPTQTTISGAAKLIGREASGLSYGLLAATTQEATATVMRGGQEQRVVVAPPSDFGVARLRREFDHGHGSIGAMVTYVGRRLAPELRPLMVEQALGGAADFEFRHGDLGVIANVLGTRLAGSADAIAAVQRSSTNLLQRPDAHHLGYDPTRTDLTGWGAELVGGKLDGSPWRATWGVRARSPGLNPNDLGYLQRADQQHAEFWLQWRQDRPGSWYRYWHVATNSWLEKTFGPEVTALGAGINGYLQLPDHSATYVGVRRHLQALDVNLLRGGPAFLLPGRWEGWWGIGTDERRAFEVDLDLWGEVRDHGSLARGNVSVSLNIHPSSSVRISLIPSFERSRDSLQYVGADLLGDAVLGQLHRNTVSMALRASWAMTTRLTLEAYAMPYLTAGKYSRFYQVREPRAENYTDRLRLTDYDGADRFDLGQLRANLLLRWEYMPGSMAYLAWTREQTNQADQFGVVRLDRDLAAVLRNRSSDVILLKLMHWFSL